MSPQGTCFHDDHVQVGMPAWSAVTKRLPHSEAEFEMLLDHETRTCFQRYMLPGDVESLLYTGHQKPPPKKKGRKTSK